MDATIPGGSPAVPAAHHDAAPHDVAHPDPRAPGWAVGVDIGGTKVQAALLDPDGRVVGTRRRATRPGPDGLVAAVTTTVRELAAEHGVPVGALAGTGIGVPGVVDPVTGSVEHAVNVGVERPFALAAAVADALGAGARVRVENDLNVAVLGAAHTMASSFAHRDLAFLALGTGVAAGLLLDGTLRRGSHRAAGEVGHLTLVPDGLPCKCGQRGCVEQYASGSALDAAWPSRDGRPAPVAVFEAAAAGDPRAVAVRDRFVWAVAGAVRILVLTCDVDHVVVGGGVSGVGEPLLGAVRVELERETAASPFLASLRLADRVHLAPQDVPVGAVGAALVGRGEIV
ncbi:ROK family protein [Cellulomonas phragmiteti]|uniref:NagC family transcriptional regulator n=1 Tax=Cellulomonas phragmiteti TaxID=478780 RepID=A0ABQ4DGZ3_9CELL|nr:ROK family protein [Cellulomonas phragmiteti]GIG38287.1 NagC family transcriptional regulator [Cellulomonas phragmiteti]